MQLLVDLGARSYPIHIASGALARAGSLIAPCLAAPQALIIADATVAALHGATLRQSLAAAGIHAELVAFPPGERSKTLDTAAQLWDACARHRLGRDGAILALGGGVAGDLAGFVAACWMRGVRFVQAPTTLLAMVDSAVGGKTGIDIPAGKNLIGAFCQPVAVICDPAVLTTLDERNYRAGLAEVIKYGVIRDAALLAWLEGQAEAVSARDPEAIAHIVHESCRIKAWYVACDEREEGLRAELNLGHTFGHALEAESGYQGLLHGEAVAIGMRLACVLARSLGVLADPDLPARLDALLTRFGLPLRYPATDPALIERLVARTALDKKARGGRVRFVLPVRAGQVTVLPVADQAAIAAAFREGCQ
ncbi:MAG: 3-dehydroquinate synthase [Planctomycetota bacterium]|nr:3-dehydroquinate synthase [Planctomycetota bacterium]